MKPFFVIDVLGDLLGPASGAVTLPVSIDWTPANTFDLADRIRLRSMYAKVLAEAPDEAALGRYLNRDLLIREWRSLRLPDYIRRAWEDAHPELASC